MLKNQRLHYCLHLWSFSYGWWWMSKVFSNFRFRWSAHLIHCFGFQLLVAFGCFLLLPALCLYILYIYFFWLHCCYFWIAKSQSIQTFRMLCRISSILFAHSLLFCALLVPAQGPSKLFCKRSHLPSFLQLSLGTSLFFALCSGIFYSSLPFLMQCFPFIFA